MLRLFVLAAALLTGAIGALERLALPSVELEAPVWAEHAAGSEVRVDHDAWDLFLSAYVAPDGAGIHRVAYGAVTAADRAALKGYIGRLETTDPRRLDRPEQLAYWINLYNAVTVDLVLGAYPVDTIREIEGGLFDTGPWGEKVVEILGRPLSLDDIEHRIIRAVWDEPRIHYAVNCAAVGCPNLMPRAWRADTLEADFAAAERAFVGDPRGVRLEGGELVLSRIYFWFREDFGEDEAAILDGLRRVATGRAAAALRGRTAVDRYEYDWSLNER